MKTLLLVLLTLIGSKSFAADPLKPHPSKKYSSYFVQAAPNSTSVTVVLELKTTNCNAKTLETRLQPMVGDLAVGIQSMAMIDSEVAGYYMNCVGKNPPVKTLRSDLIEIPVDYPGASIELIVRDGIMVYQQD